MVDLSELQNSPLIVTISFGLIGVLLLYLREYFRGRFTGKIKREELRVEYLFKNEAGFREYVDRLLQILVLFKSNLVNDERPETLLGDKSEDVLFVAGNSNCWTFTKFKIFKYFIHELPVIIRAYGMTFPNQKNETVEDEVAINEEYVQFKTGLKDIVNFLSIMLIEDASIRISTLLTGGDLKAVSNKLNKIEEYIEEEGIWALTGTEEIVKRTIKTAYKIVTGKEDYPFFIKFPLR